MPERHTTSAAAKRSARVAGGGSARDVGANAFLTRAPFHGPSGCWGRADSPKHYADAMADAEFAAAARRSPSRRPTTRRARASTRASARGRVHGYDELTAALQRPPPRVRVLVKPADGLL